MQLQPTRCQFYICIQDKQIVLARVSYFVNYTYSSVTFNVAGCKWRRENKVFYFTLLIINKQNYVFP
jgi:hypothetical protein